MNLPPRAVGPLIARRVSNQIAVLDVIRQRVVDLAKLFVPGRKEEPATALHRQLTQEPFPFDGDARDASDAHDVDRCPGRAHRRESILV